MPPGLSPASGRLDARADGRGGQVAALNEAPVRALADWARPVTADAVVVVKKGHGSSSLTARADSTCIARRFEDGLGHWVVDRMA